MSQPNYSDVVVVVFAIDDVVVVSVVTVVFSLN